MLTTRLRARGFELIADCFPGGANAQVLLLHGLGGNRLTWRLAAPHIARRFRATVWAVDLPGFGASRSRFRPMSLELHRAVVEECMRGCGSPGVPWTVMGNSMGGVLALALSESKQVNLREVVLACPALPLFWGRRPSSLPLFVKFVPSALPWFGSRLILNYVVRTGVPGVVDDPIQLLCAHPGRLDPELRKQFIELSSERLTWAAEAAHALQSMTWNLGWFLLRPSGAASLIRRVDCPVVVVHGTSDPLYPKGAWQRLRAERPDWRYRCIEDVGHLPQLEAPESFGAALPAPREVLYGTRDKE